MAAYPLNGDMAGTEYSGARDWLIANNAIAFNENRGGIVLWQDGVVDAVVQNNIFYHNNGAPVDGTGQKGKGHVLRSNIFFPPTTIYERLGGGEFHSTGNLNVDPSFVDPEALDFRLRAGSPAIDRGIAERAPLYDFASTPRPQGTAVDIGALEFEPATTITAVRGDTPPEAGPISVDLRNAPNPFNATTRISFTASRSGTASLSIHDMAGQRVRELRRGAVEAGEHTIEWDGTDESGRPVGSGVYLARLRLSGTVIVQLLALIR